MSAPALPLLVHQSARVGTSLPAFTTSGLVLPNLFLQGHTLLCCTGEGQGPLLSAEAGEGQRYLSCSYDPRDSSPSWHRWWGVVGGRDLSLTHTIMQQKGVGPDLHAQVLRQLIGAQVNRLSSARLLRWGKGPTFSSGAGKGMVNSLTSWRQKGKRGRASFPHLHYHTTDKRGGISYVHLTPSGLACQRHSWRNDLYLHYWLVCAICHSAWIRLVLFPIDFDHRTWETHKTP